jgi:alpha-tubulin suppressor-like RCC1 family protein
VVSNCGDLHSLALKTDGTCGVGGVTASGNLGINNTITRSPPVQIGALTTWSQVAAGDSFIASPLKPTALCGVGGRITTGDLGLNNTISRSSPVQVGASLRGHKLRLEMNTTSPLKPTVHCGLGQWQRNGELGITP